MRSQILGYNESLWRPVREKVADWIETNWPAWKQGQPPWFTQAWKDSIPDDMLPKSFAAMMASDPQLEATPLASVFPVTPPQPHPDALTAVQPCRGQQLSWLGAAS